MATTTAILLVGKAHPNDGGIIIQDELYLTENSRPLWTNTQKAVVPTLENMLQDGILLAFCDEPQVSSLFLETFGYTVKKPEMYSIDEKLRQELYNVCKSVQCKIVLTILQGSHLLHNINTLDDYALELEVCCPSYTRTFSRWTNQTTVTNNLRESL